MMKLSAEKEAIKTVDTYIQGLNDKDPEKLANSLHFPHIRSMKDGTFFEWHSPKEYLEAFKARLETSGWDHTKLIYISTEKLSASKVHVSIEFGRYTKSGVLINNYKSLYVVIYDRGYWGIKFGSGTG
tara:strand:- start:4463 stop:4846 length:384 start_codon:yes stop_codon:yes gene_type:complete